MKSTFFSYFILSNINKLYKRPNYKRWDVITIKDHLNNLVKEEKIEIVIDKDQDKNLDIVVVKVKVSKKIVMRYI